MDFLFKFLDLLFQALTFCICVRAIMSWITPGQTNIITKVFYQITEPILSPLRRILPSFGVMDLSPMVAVIVLQVISLFILPLLRP
ncbi:YggT family protein [Chloroflexota bacterium]